MRGHLIAATLALTFVIAAAGPARSGDTHDADLIEIEKVVGYYLDSGRLGDVELLKKAFHPSLRLQFAEQGEYGEWSGKEYISWRKPGKRSRYTSRILAIDCTGDAAMVKAEMDFGNVRFVDFLSLLRLDGRWWVVNKIFDKEETGHDG